jgi:hypothetical protein
MNDQPKYYKKEYRCVVLSQDEEIDDIEFIGYNVTNGDDCLHTWEQVTSEELTGKQAADLLIDAGSDPGFFMLDENGNPQ